MLTYYLLLGSVLTPNKLLGLFLLFTLAFVILNSFSLHSLLTGFNANVIFDLYVNEPVPLKFLDSSPIYSLISSLNDSIILFLTNPSLNKNFFYALYKGSSSTISFIKDFQSHRLTLLSVSSIVGDFNVSAIFFSETFLNSIRFGFLKKNSCSFLSFYYSTSNDWSHISSYLGCDL